VCALRFRFRGQIRKVVTATDVFYSVLEGVHDSMGFGLRVLLRSNSNQCEA
jgi:hypothetical protein